MTMLTEVLERAEAVADRLGTELVRVAGGLEELDRLHRRLPGGLGNTLPSGNVPVVVTLRTNAQPLLGLLAKDSGLAAGTAFPKPFRHPLFGAFQHFFPTVRVGTGTTRTGRHSGCSHSLSEYNQLAGVDFMPTMSHSIIT